MRLLFKDKKNSGKFKVTQGRFFDSKSCDPVHTFNIYVICKLYSVCNFIVISISTLNRLTLSKKDFLKSCFTANEDKKMFAGIIFLNFEIFYRGIVVNCVALLEVSNLDV